MATTAGAVPVSFSTTIEFADHVGLPHDWLDAMVTGLGLTRTTPPRAFGAITPTELEDALTNTQVNSQAISSLILWLGGLLGV